MRPTSKHHVYLYSDNAEAKALWAALPTYVWEVELDEIDPITFKDLYPDNCNAKDDVAKQWLLANFKWMCPAIVDSDVLVDKNNYEEEKWSRLDFEKDDEPVDASAVISILEEAGIEDYYKPGDYDGCKWPCVDLCGGEDALGTAEVDALLKPAGWETREILDSAKWTDENGVERWSTTRSIVPLDHEDDDSDESEDGWQGILLTHVFLVDEERDAEVLNAAGFRVLKHEDTGTVVAQVTFCGMSNEANRARAGFLLAVDRGWPILTDKGWRRPVR